MGWVTLGNLVHTFSDSTVDHFFPSEPSRGESNKKKRGQSRVRQATQVGRVPSAAAPERRSGAGGAVAVAWERRSGAGGAVAGAKERSRRKSWARRLRGAWRGHHWIYGGRCLAEDGGGERSRGHGEDGDRECSVADPALAMAGVAAGIPTRSLAKGWPSMKRGKGWRRLGVGDASVLCSCNDLSKWSSTPRSGIESWAWYATSCYYIFPKTVYCKHFGGPFLSLGDMNFGKKRRYTSFFCSAVALI
jgi:hypothetical protein